MSVHEASLLSMHAAAEEVVDMRGAGLTHLISIVW